MAPIETTPSFSSMGPQPNQGLLAEERKWWIIMWVVVTISILLFTSLIAVYTWRNRHRIYNKLRRCLLWFTSEEIYDVYVCFPRKDRVWVRDVIKAYLQDKYGFSLCLHYNPTPKNIVLGDMEKSRCVLFVLTENFDQSTEVKEGLEVYNILQNAGIVKPALTLHFAAENNNNNAPLAGNKDIQKLLMKGEYMPWIFLADFQGQIQTLAKKIYSCLSKISHGGNWRRNLTREATKSVVISKPTETISLSKTVCGYNSLASSSQTVCSSGSPLDDVKHKSPIEANIDLKNDCV